MILSECIVNMKRLLFFCHVKNINYNLHREKNDFMGLSETSFLTSDIMVFPSLSLLKGIFRYFCIRRKTITYGILSNSGLINSGK